VPSESRERQKSSWLFRWHPEDTLDELRGEVDEIVFLGSPSPFIAVGAHYAEFAQLADADVVALLEKRHRATSCPADRPDG
jgi:predicted phosphoribosyltransferase